MQYKLFIIRGTFYLKRLKEWRCYRMNTNVGDIEVEKMYNPLYVQAYEFLKSNFNEPFVYKVWDEKGPIIGINDNEEVHYYKYSFENEKLQIVGENNEYRKIL